MSKHCNCCASDEQYVQEHLSWNINDVYGEDEIRDFTQEDWLREAEDCIRTWGQNMIETRDFRLPAAGRLAELLEAVYGLSVSA